ncbi:hypothetical protein [Brevibacterium samyangense]|uniref:Uncharacterized protein n=1 Tax=Brevibacterium samyangense TaxID=366888 RepID=A0ABN2T7T0_9MICO
MITEPHHDRDDVPLDLYGLPAVPLDERTPEPAPCPDDLPTQGFCWFRRNLAWLVSGGVVVLGLGIAAAIHLLG